MGARHYAPDLGRFLSRDPLGFHDHSYALDNSLSFRSLHFNPSIPLCSIPEKLSAGGTISPDMEDPRVRLDHRVYRSLVNARQEARLPEPFRCKDILAACPGFARATYYTFPYKHAEANPGGSSLPEV